MRKFVIAGIISITVLLAAGWIFGRPAYRQFKERRNASLARASFEKGDYASAQLNARLALILNSNNFDAAFVMANLAELSRSPMVIDWRKRVADIEPTPENRLMLAAAGLRYQSPPFALSAQILEELSGTASNVPGFHLVSAEKALKLDQPREAERHFAIAADLETTNRLHQLNLAVLRLGSSNLAAAARESLESFRGDTNLGPVALRWLVADTMGRKEFATAESLSAELLGLPAANLEDQLQHFDLLRQLKSPKLGEFVSNLKRQYATNPPAIYGLAVWMAANDLADEALAWIHGLPEAVRQQQPVPLAINDCLVARRDWAGLEKFLREERWKDLEFLRFAYLSLAAEKLGGGLGVEGQWRLAVREAEDRLGSLTGLLSLADRWKRETAREELLWKIVDRFPREKWVYRELDRLYVASGNTRGLNKIYSAMLKTSPADKALKNNLAATALLLNANLAQAHELAREVFEANGTEPVPASTYAFSLHVQGKTAEGLAVLATLKPEELARQPVALYKGLLLWAAGRTNEAKYFLEIAAADRNLLPEEKALLSRCK
jgi:hypothetical protein